MSHRRQTLEAISKLLSYPTETYVEAAEMLYVILQSELPEAAEVHGEVWRAMPNRWKFTNWRRTTPARSTSIRPVRLEVGWHLFGEEYTRGLFLVRLRGEMRDRGIEESSELPDHVAHVLAVVAAMPARRGAAFRASLRAARRGQNVQGPGGRRQPVPARRPLPRRGTGTRVRPSGTSSWRRSAGRRRADRDAARGPAS